MHLRVEISWRQMRQAYDATLLPGSFEWFCDLIESAGFQQSMDTCVWFAEPATEDQLQLAAEIYEVSNPMALAEIGAAWVV